MRAGPSDPVMAETKQTTAATTENRDRRSEPIRFVKRRFVRGQWLKLAIFMLPPIALAGWGAALAIFRGEPLRGMLGLGLVVALAFLIFVVFEVALPALADWWGLDGWIEKRLSKTLKKRLSALSDAQKAPFQTEQRCNVSPTEAVWVRHIRNTQLQEHGSILEVLYSKDNGQTWEKLPLRLSPWARFKCTMLDGEWPPTWGSRNLSCDNNCISFEVQGADNWSDWQNVWRATYRPRRKWWTLKVVGLLWMGAHSERLLND